MHILWQGWIWSMLHDVMLLVQVLQHPCPLVMKPKGNNIYMQISYEYMHTRSWRIINRSYYPTKWRYWWFTINVLSFPAFGSLKPLFSVTFQMMHTKSETYVRMRYEYLSFISITLLFLGFLSCDGLKAYLHHVEGRKRCFF